LKISKIHLAKNVTTNNLGYLHSKVIGGRACMNPHKSINGIFLNHDVSYRPTWCIVAQLNSQENTPWTNLSPQEDQTTQTTHYFIVNQKYIFALTTTFHGLQTSLW
jgi:hypothetical protein